MKNITPQFYEEIQELNNKFINDIENEVKKEINYKKIKEKSYDSKEDLCFIALSRNKKNSIGLYKLNDNYLLISDNRIVDVIENEKILNVITYYSLENLPNLFVLLKEKEANIIEYKETLSMHSNIKDLKEVKIVCFDKIKVNNTRFLNDVINLFKSDYYKFTQLKNPNIKKLKMNLSKINIENYDISEGKVYWETKNSKEEIEIVNKYYLKMPDFFFVKDNNKYLIKNNILVFSEIKRSSDYLETNYLLLTNLYKINDAQKKSKHVLLRLNKQKNLKTFVKPMLSYYYDTEKETYKVSLSVLLKYGNKNYVINVPSCGYRIPLFELKKFLKEKNENLGEGFKFGDIIKSLNKKN